MFLLDMPELGAQGNARVLGVYPCPEIKPGPGQVITATFAHPSTFKILDATIGEGDDAETIGVTETHPFWSETHQAFVPVGQLSVGDELLTLHGQKKRLTALLPRPGPPERVYNLEVHGEHTYYVGHQQLLVHNVYPMDIKFSRLVSPDEVFRDGPWRGRSLTEAIEETKRLGHLPEGLTLHADLVNDVWVAANNRTLFVAQQAGLKNVNPVRGDGVQRTILEHFKNNGVGTWIGFFE